LSVHVTQNLDLRVFAAAPAADVFGRLETSPSGLSTTEAEARLEHYGRNTVEQRRATPWGVLVRQLANPFLILLVATALVSLWLHDSSDAVIILFIIVLTVGLSFVNEYASERAVADLRARIARRAVVLRDGNLQNVDVRDLVPGDVVKVSVGDIVPADLRLTEVRDLECDESALTGEPMPAPKSASPCTAPESALDLASCAYSGTVVKNGTATGVVVATGRAAVFGTIAHELSRHPPQTAFQVGLQRFSLLLVRITVVLTAAIFAGNAFLRHPLIESMLFALAIAIGITPQLLPAIVTISLSFGARQLAKRSVLVKRLVSIEDLGNVEVLFTDKTGTLTQGKISFRTALGADGSPSEDVAVLALLCTDVVIEGGKPVSGNALDVALWEGATPERLAAAARYRVLDRAPFDFQRQMMSVLVEAPDGTRMLLAKGASEAIEARSVAFDPRLRQTVDEQLDAGNRTVVIATAVASGASTLEDAQENRLSPLGALTFVDEPKADAAESLRRLAALKIRLKIVTGDSARTAQFVCKELGLTIDGVLAGKEVAELSDAELGERLERTTIFARVTPDQKSRIIKLQRAKDVDVGFLGDGVNDAPALHEADVGISVDSAADVAKDAADIVLLEKDLDILADGVVEGRRIFANTIKYVLMGTSSNFGNMFSAAGASLFLPFLPMLPSQILLNNLLYDISEMTIPTDNVDEEQLQRPERWNIRFIARFMLAFGPISSIFDFVTYGVMLLVFHAGANLFRTGWFVESLATQSLVIFLIRTHRIPFFTSLPSVPLTVTTLAIVALGVALPFTPAAAFLGFVAPPPAFFGVLALMVVMYLALIELAKRVFFGPAAPKA
jgi:Mg2+-importing ATPase